LVQEGKHIVLRWTINSGPNCNGITILRTTDQLEYKEIGKIPGVCGNSFVDEFYEFKDEFAVIGKTNYYLVKMGYSQFSDEIGLFLNYTAEGILRIFPNPARYETEIQFNNDMNEPVTISAYNHIGQQLYRIDNIRLNRQIIPLENLSPGIYLITVQYSQGILLRKQMLVQ
jgi:hypothetical protein